MDDKSIVDLYLERNEIAIKETELKYNNYLYKIAYNILYSDEDSKESVNDTYLAAWKSIPPNIPTIFSAYLGKITRRIAIDIYRKESCKKRGGKEVNLSLFELTDCIPSNYSIEKHIENAELGKAISNYLRTISKENRIVFVRRYFFADSIKIIASNFAISESKVKSILFRTRKGLKLFLEKEGIFI